MADLAYRNEFPAIAPRRTDWGAIWAGVFVFIGIWSVFGLLGMAIFASAANANAAQPVTGMGVGEAIWGIILTAIAMYVAERETGHLARQESRQDGLIHGLIMFGLARKQTGLPLPLRRFLVYSAGTVSFASSDRLLSFPRTSTADTE